MQAKLSLRLAGVSLLMATFSSTTLADCGKETGCTASLMLAQQQAVETVKTPAPAAPKNLLGDLATYRAIASDTLAIVKTGDLPAAAKRATDLETAWDEAEKAMRARDGKNWRIVDKAIDRALDALREDHPVAEECRKALEDLLVIIDSMKT